MSCFISSKHKYSFPLNGWDFSLDLFVYCKVTFRYEFLSINLISLDQVDVIRAPIVKKIHFPSSSLCDCEACWLNQCYSRFIIPLGCLLYLFCLRYHILIWYQHFTAWSSEMFSSQQAGNMAADSETEALTVQITWDKPSAGRSSHRAACLIHRATYAAVLSSDFWKCHLAGKWIHLCAVTGTEIHRKVGQLGRYYSTCNQNMHNCICLSA